MRRRIARCLAPLIVLSLAVPAFADDGTPSAAESRALPAVFDGGVCPDIPATVVESYAVPALGTPDPQPVIGCTATYNCVHGTIVSCSSPVNGTCQASGAGCGAVFCNGQAIWCPGRCIGDQHCLNFCGFDPDAFCDELGCCDCG